MTPPPPRSVRGPILVGVVMAIAIGTAVAGILWMRSARPVPGTYVDALATPDGAILVRKEANGPNYFVERWAGGKLRWRGLVPPYDGAPGRIGVRVNAEKVGVRVRRGGKPQEFLFERERGLKIDTVTMTEAEADAAYPPAAGKQTLHAPDGREVAAEPYQTAGNVVWVVSPDEVIGLELPALRPVVTIR